MKSLLLLSSVLITMAATPAVADHHLISEPEEAILYQRSRAVELSAIGRVSTSGGALNVRAEPSTSAQVLTKLLNRTYLQIFGSSGEWYRVTYGASASRGYVSKSYVDIASTDVRTVNATRLNIRKGPSTGSTKVGSFAEGTRVGVIKDEGSWSLISFDGIKTGYVSDRYLSASPSSAQAYPAIKLDVVSYKQFDSRWADKKLGNSDTTFRRSGCTTTALAMTESFRLKRTVTPLDFAKKSSYTSGGALYWPTATYKVDTSSTSYLNKIYHLLKSGKPAVIGLKKASGAQHYVTIVGYSGGDSLSASSFLINDPGSSTRTRLSEVLVTHPNFYKLVSAK